MTPPRRGPALSGPGPQHATLPVETKSTTVGANAPSQLAFFTVTDDEHAEQLRLATEMADAQAVCRRLAWRHAELAWNRCMETEYVGEYDDNDENVDPTYQEHLQGLLAALVVGRYRNFGEMMDAELAAIEHPAVQR